MSYVEDVEPEEGEKIDSESLTEEQLWTRIRSLGMREPILIFYLLEIIIEKMELDHEEILREAMEKWMNA